MRGFHRASLTGSDELFRKSEGDAETTTATSVKDVPKEELLHAPEINKPAGNLIRLSDDEVRALADAIQKMKFPQKPGGNNPTMDEYEWLEELRQRLLSHLQ
jgi:hypothetical protein